MKARGRIINSGERAEAPAQTGMGLTAGVLRGHASTCYLTVGSEAQPSSRRACPSRSRPSGPPCPVLLRGGAHERDRVLVDGLVGTLMSTVSTHRPRPGTTCRRCRRRPGRRSFLPRTSVTACSPETGCRVTELPGEGLGELTAGNPRAYQLNAVERGESMLLAGLPGRNEARPAGREAGSVVDWEASAAFHGGPVRGGHIIDVRTLAERVTRSCDPAKLKRTSTSAGGLKEDLLLRRSRSARRQRTLRTTSREGTVAAIDRGRGVYGECRPSAARARAAAPYRGGSGGNAQGLP